MRIMQYISNQQKTNTSAAFTLYTNLCAFIYFLLTLYVFSELFSSYISLLELIILSLSFQAITLQFLRAQLFICHVRHLIKRSRDGHSNALLSPEKSSSPRFIKNSTLKKERADPTLRFTHTTDHLIISNLQLQDSGLYLCNNREMALLTVTTGSTEHNINTEYTIISIRIGISLVYSYKKSMIPCKKVSPKHI